MRDELIISYSPPLTRSIRDPIHGNIRFSQDEMSVIGHSLFQRLHKIKQNGLLYLVFPSATNTRFEHSLGTVFIAQSILENLIINSYIASVKDSPAVAKIDNYNKGQAISFHNLNPEHLKFIFRLTRLAALVHDIGHGPLSHFFDSFAPKKEDIARIISNNEKLSHLSWILNSTYFKTLNGERVNHEIMSCLLFSYIWKSLGRDDDTANMVASVILGSIEGCHEKEIIQYIPLMHDILSSAPADADRMDYLERDSRSFGVNYGLYDKERLLKSFIVYVTLFNKQEVFRLGIKFSGLRAIENFIQARFQLYVQIYYHKTNRAIYMMLNEINNLLKEINFEFLNGPDYNQLLELYQELSDERFINILRGIDNKWKLDNKRINKIAENIFNRRLWKRIFEDKCGELVKKVYDNLIINNADILSRIKIDEISPQATKGLDSGVSLLKRGSDGIYQVINDSCWTNESPIIKTLSNEEKEIFRIYLDGDGLETNEIKRLRDEALRLRGK